MSSTRKAANVADSGDARATIRDVAARAGVSVATVSRVLNGTYAAPVDTTDKVMRAVSDLDYVTNASARALTTTKTRTVGIVVPSLTSSFFMNVAAGVEEQAYADGHMCVVASTQGDPARELSALTMMRERGVDVLVLTGGGLAQSAEHEGRVALLARSLRSTGTQLVVCARPTFPTAAGIAAISVSFDNHGGAYAATRHLLAAGHTRIAYLGGRDAHTFTPARVDGYRQALADHGVAVTPELISSGPMRRGEAYDRTLGLLGVPGGFTALFAATDSVAASAIAALGKAGYAVPGDISIVGFNDDPVAAELTPALTTVHVPQAELGRMAVREALHPTGAPAVERDPIVLGTHVVVRDSVRTLPR